MSIADKQQDIYAVIILIHIRTHLHDFKRKCGGDVTSALSSDHFQSFHTPECLTAFENCGMPKRLVISEHIL